MKSLINNFINGNLKTAKEQAKKYNIQKIWLCFVFDFGWSATRAKAAARYLKFPSQATWNEYCSY